MYIHLNIQPEGPSVSGYLSDVLLKGYVEVGEKRRLYSGIASATSHTLTEGRVVALTTEVVIPRVMYQLQVV